MPKSNVVAISRFGINNHLYVEGMSIRSIKAFFLVLTGIYWGRDTVSAIGEQPHLQKKVELQLGYMADILGYVYNDRFTTELRKIYRVMEEEAFLTPRDRAFGWPKEKIRSFAEAERWFSLEGFNRKKGTAIFKIEKPEYLLNLGEEKGGFIKFNPDNFFALTSTYAARLLWALRLAVSYREVKSLKKDKSSYHVAQFHTALLKRKLGMDILKYCYIDKKKNQQLILDRFPFSCDSDPDFDLDFVHRYAEALDQLVLNDNPYKWKQTMPKLMYEYGFDNQKEMFEVYTQIVSFERTKFEELLQNALLEIQNSHAYNILEFENRYTYKEEKQKRKQLFEVSRRKNHYVDHYNIWFR